MSPEAGAGHETVGTIFHRARRARQLSLRQVAAQVGVTYAYIADLEKDRRLPSDATALKLAELLGLDPDELLARMGRLRQTVMDELRQHPEQGRVLGRIVQQRLSGEHLERLLRQIDREAGQPGHGRQPPTQ